MPAERDLTIGALSRRSGVKIETIRYYERIGLLAPPPRTAGGHRLYRGTHLERLLFVRRGRELGFSLDAVRNLLELVDGGHSCAEIRATASLHLDDTRRKIADLQRMERTLSDVVARCEGGEAPDCPIVEALSGRREA